MEDMDREEVETILEVGGEYAFYYQGYRIQVSASGGVVSIKAVNLENNRKFEFENITYIKESMTLEDLIKNNVMFQNMSKYTIQSKKFLYMRCTRKK